MSTSNDHSAAWMDLSQSFMQLHILVKNCEATASHILVSYQRTAGEKNQKDEERRASEAGMWIMTHGSSNQLTRPSKRAVMVWHQPVDVDHIWCQPAGQGYTRPLLRVQLLSDWVPSCGPTHCRVRLNLLRAFWRQRRRINGRLGGQNSLATGPDFAEGNVSSGSQLWSRCGLTSCARIGAHKREHVISSGSSEGIRHLMQSHRLFCRYG